MNDKIINIAERYVSCPVCRRKADQAKLMSKDYKCECGAEYTALVSKWFVATVLIDPKEKEKPLEERLKKYQEQIFQLAQ
ncbi:MAG: hypothetical protein Q4D29_10250 [Lachnospiraceae bacterium]|nr:hypothetical protein [Lachnospiraceae bacterium]